MENIQETLTIATEGGRHMIAYLLANGVKADTYVLEPVKLKQFVPYINNNSHLLLIIKGLTDFTIADIYNMIEYIGQGGVPLENVNILSNIDLGDIGISYYFYTGDLFWGDVFLVDKNKKRHKLTVDGKIAKELDKEKTFIDKIAKKEVEREQSKQKKRTRHNPIMHKYTRFTVDRELPKDRMYIYDREKEIETVNEDTLLEHITEVDLFTNNK